jgi:hypothetical protein
VLDLFGSFAILVALYLLVTYLLLPALWSHYEHEPGLRELPMRTRTHEGIAGDALNVGLVGEARDLVGTMRAAGWLPADPITLKTSMEIAGSVILHRPDPYAPVSNLFYDGRRQDLAFEKPVGASAGQRHHVRLWRVLDAGRDGRPVWLGAATFDRGVGFSHRTGQITHHIAADIDTERDRLLADLTRTGTLSRIASVSGIGPTLRARNGGGDLFHTDGDVHIGVIRPGARLGGGAAEVMASPQRVALKNRAWERIKAAAAATGLLPE